jgi:hypothetical protein
VTHKFAVMRYCGKSMVDSSDLDFKLISSFDIVNFRSAATTDAHIRARLRIMTLATCSPTES